jgi:Flp pilus assembly pilin Flp
MNFNVKRPVFLSLPTAQHLRRRINCRGQTLVEYALILAFISVVAISILINLGLNLRSVYTTIDSQVARAPGGANYNPGG